MRFVTTGSLNWLSRKNQPFLRSGASNRVANDCMCTRPVTLSISVAGIGVGWRGGGGGVGSNVVLLR